MGQYYQPTSIDRLEYLYTHDYEGNGLKLMEHSWVGNIFVDTICNLLKKGGIWHKTRIAWIGDYTKPDDLAEVQVGDKCFDLHELYDKPSSDNPKGVIKKIKPKAKKMPGSYLLVNHSKKQFVDITKCKPVTVAWSDDEDDKIHPLPLLTASSNGRGGGDFFPSNNSGKYIGTWCGDIISVEFEMPDGYKEIVPNFIE